MIKYLEIGLITPPVGLTVYIIKGVGRRSSRADPDIPWRLVVHRHGYCHLADLDILPPDIPVAARYDAGHQGVFRQSFLRSDPC